MVSDGQDVSVPEQVEDDQAQPIWSPHAVWLVIDAHGAIVPLQVLVALFQVHPVASSQYVSYEADSLKMAQVSSVVPVQLAVVPAVQPGHSVEEQP